jgi:hypothetical protein
MSAHMLGRWTWLALGAAGTLAAAGAQAAHGVGAAAFAADDSEGFATRRVALGYLPTFAGRDAHTGVRVGATRFSQQGWRRDAQQLSVIHRSIDPATTDGWQVEGGLSRQGERELLTLDASYRRALAEKRSVELFVSRDWVETRRALDDGVSVVFAGAALEQGLGEHVTLVGVAGYQDFSDGNHRTHGRAKLIVQPKLDLGLTLQARYRTYRGANDGVARTYFNPSRYDEAMLAVGYRKRLAGWMASVTAGVGRQRVGDAARTASRLFEASLESPAHASHSLRFRAGYNRSASFGGPDYNFRYAQVEWHVGF